jgi:glutamine cyclotransferase
MKRVFALLLLTAIFACNNPSDQPSETEEITETATGIPAPQNIPYQIISVYPHDNTSYTQGLEIYKGKLYEGSGNYEKSGIQIADIKTGKVEKKHTMGTAEIFGEGITILNGLLYQLTWENNLVYIYNVNDITKPIKSQTWPYAGWGITNNGKDLIISDGSANIYFVNPETFKINTTIQIKDNFGPIKEINELEYIDGFIFANVYTTDYIIKINPANGQVVGKISLPGIIKQYAPDYNPNQGEVLNGIAWDSTNKKLLVTGKNWPKLFELSLN